jgi:hypothetical protein
MRRRLAPTAAPLLLAVTVTLGAAAAAPAPPPHSAPAPAPAAHAAPAPAPSSHAAAAPSRPSAGGGMAPYRGGGPAAASRSMIPVKGQAGIGKTATSAYQPQQRVGLKAKSYICHERNGALYYSDSPCDDAGPGGDDDYWAGAQAGDLYIVNFWMVPGSPETGPAGVPGIPGGGGAAQQRLPGGHRPTVPATAPRTVWMQDPGASGAGLPATRDQEALPVQTRLSDTPVSYAVVLRDGTALASVVPPRQSGNMIIGKDRTGHLYSIRATEVDRAASRLPDATAIAKP